MEWIKHPEYGVLEFPDCEFCGDSGFMQGRSGTEVYPCDQCAAGRNYRLWWERRRERDKNSPTTDASDPTAAWIFKASHVVEWREVRWDSDYGRELTANWLRSRASEAEERKRRRELSRSVKRQGRGRAMTGDPTEREIEDRRNAAQRALRERDAKAGREARMG